MAMTPSGLAAAITAQQGPAQDTGIQNDVNLKLATAIVQYLQANMTITIPINVINTAGSASNQSGPTPNPLVLNGAVS